MTTVPSGVLRDWAVTIHVCQAGIAFPTIYPYFGASWYDLVQIMWCSMNMTSERLVPLCIKNNKYFGEKSCQLHFLGHISIVSPKCFWNQLTCQFRVAVRIFWISLLFGIVIFANLDINHLPVDDQIPKNSDQGLFSWFVAKTWDLLFLQRSHLQSEVCCLWRMITRK